MLYVTVELLWIYLISGAAIKTILMVFGVVLIMVLIYVIYRLLCCIPYQRGTKRNDFEYEKESDTIDEKVDDENIYLDGMDQSEIKPLGQNERPSGEVYTKNTSWPEFEEYRASSTRFS